ncbi:MAG: AMP-binding protein [Acidobacteriota bacterium]
MERLGPEELKRVQLLKLKRILRWAYDRSPFYRQQFDQAGVSVDDIRSLDDLAKIPLTDKDAWLAAQGDCSDGFGTTTAISEREVVRYHQTSGTTGNPIRLAFNHRDWNWWLECWGYGLAALELNQHDRALVCFPFNLFVGWWGGQDAARLMRCCVYSGGGMTTEQRLQVILDHRITVLMGAPSYLLRLASSARQRGVRTSELTVRKLVCGAEPGGSIPATRRRLEQAWGAEVFDHLGASEVGPWGYECSAHPGGVHICEGFFFMEFVHPQTFEPTRPGELSRLVVTSLEKYSQPVIRWDLKDLVRVSEQPCPCGRSFRWVKGGILGRADDLIKIRGVLFSPRGVEDVVRTFEPVGEYRVVLSRRGEMDELTLRAETALCGSEGDPLKEELVTALKVKTQLRFGIELCPPGTFPRQEIKTRRLIDLREEEGANAQS